MMHFTVRLEVFTWALEFGILCGVIAHQVTVLVIAEYLHLPCLRGHTPISGICRVLRLLMAEHMLNPLVLLQN